MFSVYVPIISPQTARYAFPLKEYENEEDVWKD